MMVESEATHHPAATATLWRFVTGFVVVGLVGIGTWASYFASFRNDHYQLIYLGYTVYDGGRMYVDCWENKPPGLAWLHAGAFLLTGGWPVAPWLLVGGLALAAIFAFGITVRRLWGRSAALLSVVSAAIVITIREYDTPSINPDFYASMFQMLASAALMAALRPQTPRYRLLAFLSGLGWATALACKQTGALGLLAFSAALLLIPAKDEHGAEHRRILRLTWGGLVVGVGLQLAVLWLRGNLDEAWYAVVTCNFDLVSAHSFGYGWLRVAGFCRLLGLPLWLGGLVPVSAFFKGTFKPYTRRIVLTLVLWWFLEAAFALQGPLGQLRYWQGTTPAMLWLGAGGLAVLVRSWSRAASGQRAVFLFVVLSFVAVVSGPMRQQYVYGWNQAFYNFTASQPSEHAVLARIGRSVRRHTSADDRIFVCKYDPGVYVHSRRRCATRYTYPRDRQQQRHIIERLESGAADLILIQGDPAETRCRAFKGAADRLVELLKDYEEVDRAATYRLMKRLH